MPAYLGNTDLQKHYLGSNPISSLWLGSNKIWPLTTSAPNFGIGFDGPIYTVNVQSDDKILVLGLFTSYKGQAVRGICRLLPNGDLDSTFNPGGSGINNAPGGNNLLLANNKIVVIADNYNGVNIPAKIFRLNLDGSIDTTFNPGTGFSTYPADIDIQSTGKIVVLAGTSLRTGLIGTYNGGGTVSPFRINQDGSYDPTFNSNGCYPANGGSGGTYFSSIRVAPDNTIIIGGSFAWIASPLARGGFAPINGWGLQRWSPNFTPGGGPIIGTGNYVSVERIQISPDRTKMIYGLRSYIGGTYTPPLGYQNLSNGFTISFSPFTSMPNPSRYPFFGGAYGVNDNGNITYNYPEWVNGFTQPAVNTLVQRNLENGTQFFKGIINSGDVGVVKGYTNNSTIVAGSISSYNSRYVGKLMIVDISGSRIDKSLGQVSGSYQAGPVPALIQYFNLAGGTAFSGSGGPPYVELYTTKDYSLAYGASAADGWLQFKESGSLIALGNEAFANCVSINTIELNSCKTVGQYSLFSCPLLKTIKLPALSGSNALGGSPGFNAVFGGAFGGVSAISGSLTVPVYLATVNGGNPDGDIQYLMGRGWKINYI